MPLKGPSVKEAGTSRQIAGLRGGSFVEIKGDYSDMGSPNISVQIINSGDLLVRSTTHPSGDGNVRNRGASLPMYAVSNGCPLI